MITYLFDKSFHNLFDNHAMFKHIYYWDKYVNPETKKRCQNWCSQFNYAKEALKLIKQVKSEVIY